MTFFHFDPIFLFLLDLLSHINSITLLFYLILCHLHPIIFLPLHLPFFRIVDLIFSVIMLDSMPTVGNESGYWGVSAALGHESRPILTIAMSSVNE